MKLLSQPIAVDRELALQLDLCGHFATVQAGATLLIGLHPWSAKHPQPGTNGAVQIGLKLSPNEPIGQFAERLRRRGVDVSDVIESEEASYVSFADPDRNPILVGDWHPDFDVEYKTDDTLVDT